MRHSRVVFFVREAIYEARQGFMTIITPIVFFGLLAYVFTVLLSAESMRSLGAVGIYRNSPHIIFLVVSSQCLWLFFAWAWLFAQIVVRDRSAQLHEVVLASPVSLPLLLAARFSGALCVAVFMGMSICVGMLMAPILVPLGALPESAIGPVPWTATLWSFFVFIVPNAFATGVLFLVATVWTRSNAGAFSVAALLMLIWMICLVVLRNGDVSPVLATIIDPSGFTEAERQSNLWTPAEKKVAMMSFTGALLLNRGLWLLIGMVFGSLLLLRVRREHLALEVEPRTKLSSTDNACASSKNTSPPEFSAASTGSTTGTPVSHIKWLRSAINECAWHLKMSLQGFGFRLSLLLLAIVGVVVSWQHHRLHIDGPLIPTPEAQLLFMVDFYAAVLLFIVVGFVGAMMRRDDNEGFCEWIDTYPMPLGLRILARFSAALGLTALLCIVPAVASLVVTVWLAPQSLNVLYPFANVLFTMFPALAELCAFTMLVHAIFQRAGTAYVVSIMLAFIAVLNHELGIVQYPPSEVMNIIHAYPSELASWTPWMPMIGTLMSFKFALALILFSLSWIVWRRGTALTLGRRLDMTRLRLFASPGLTLVIACILTVVLSNILEQKFIKEGGYQFTADSIDDRGRWEKDWWSQASPFSLMGGDVTINLNPTRGIGKVNWRINNLRASTLHGTLPNGIEIVSIQRDGALVDTQIDGDHFAAQTNCDAPCTLVFDLTIKPQGWQIDAMPWLHKSGIWLRAQNILPTLGHDPDRLIRSIADRARLGLAAELPPQPKPAALRSLEGVAPLGNWTWSVAIDRGKEGVIEIDNGSFEGVLDFASIWLSKKPTEYKYHSIQFLIGKARLPFVEKFARNLSVLHQCVSTELGDTPFVKQVIQAPRKTGDIVLYNDVLWAPEDIAWQNDGSGSGVWRVHYKIATAIARNAISSKSDLRYESGANWLVEGLARWLALRCVEELHGFESAIALRKRASQDIAEMFATTEKPVTKVVDADEAWLGYYAGLSLENWGEVNNHTPSFLLKALDDRENSTDLISRLKTVLGSSDLNKLLGAPVSSDVSVQHNDSGFDIAVSSWIWRDGDWHERKPENRILLRGPKTPSETYKLDKADDLLIDLEKKMDGAYLFYTDYGYEQSFDDNRLKAK